MNGRMIRAIAVLGVLCAPTAASAQFGGGFRIKTPSVKAPNTGKRLNEADQEFRKGLSALPSNYGRNPAKELEGIEKAEAHLKAGDDKLTGDLKTNSNYKNVAARRDQLAAAIPQHRAMQACSAAQAEVLKHHDKGQVAPVEALDGLDKAVAAFAQMATEGYKRNVEWWQKRAKELRDDNPVLAKKAAERANREATRELAEKKRKAFGGIDQMLKEFHATMSRGQVAIPAEKLAAYDQAIAAVVEVHAPAEHYYQAQKPELRAYDAWFADDPAAALAGALEGEVVASGESKGKSVKASFKTQGGWCYLLSVGWKQYTGSEKLEDDRPTGKGLAGVAQRFRLRSKDRRSRSYGLCTAKPVTLKYAGKLEFAGTRNGVTWAVVGWPKAKFPQHVAARMGVQAIDPCDPASWELMWNDPIPGSMVWYGGQPYLVDSPPTDSYWVDVWNLSGNRTRLKWQQLDDEMPATRKVSVKYRFPGCARVAAHAKPSQKLVKCEAKHAAKYDKLWDTWRNKKRYAKTIGQYRRAQKKLDRLGDEQDAAYARSCGKIKAKIDKAFEKSFNGLADRTIDSGFTDPLNTTVEWKRYREAYY